MLVLKFGGTSVANAENIDKVASIVGEKSKNNQIAVVVSALGGITDLLLNCGTQAAEGNESYKESLLTVENRHIEAAKSLLPIAEQSSTLSLVKMLCNELEDICKGAFLLGEFTAVTKDRITAFGEMMSSKIIAASFAARGLDAVWKDARELIVTDDSHTNAIVNFAETNSATQKYFSENKHGVTVIPGFIAAEPTGKTTTLGRGGSDYTAAIVAAAIDADSLEIWTDVAGIMTADPAHCESGQSHPRHLLPGGNGNVPFWCKSHLSPHHSACYEKADSCLDKKHVCTC